MPERDVDDLGGLSDLERELVTLGRALVTAPPRQDLATTVLARLEAVRTEPEPRPWWTRRRRVAWTVAAMTVLLLALIPPVRAAVLELLRIGGVIVREEPRPSGLPSSTRPVVATTPEPGSTAVALPQAESVLGVDISLPTALGVPTSVAIARDGRVAQVVWDRETRIVRLDIFAGSPDWGYLKRVWTDVEPATVGSREAVWISAPHLLQWIDRAGAEHSEPARLAGPTLIWVVPGPTGEVTYRLEGFTTRAEAVAVAGTAAS